MRKLLLATTMTLLSVSAMAHTTRVVQAHNVPQKGQRPIDLYQPSGSYRPSTSFQNVEMDWLFEFAGKKIGSIQNDFFYEDIARIFPLKWQVIYQEAQYIQRVKTNQFLAVQINQNKQILVELKALNKMLAKQQGGRS